jgi:hypothetical protein
MLPNASLQNAMQPLGNIALNSNAAKRLQHCKKGKKHNRKQRCMAVRQYSRKHLKTTIDMNTTKQPLFIAFSTQKGGVGKSSLTALVASVLHYRSGYNVAVFDCDFPQHSLLQMRERDRNYVMQNEVFKKLAQEQFGRLNKKAYPVIQCRAEEALQQAEAFIQSSNAAADAIFFDLPGTVGTPGVLTALTVAHHGRPCSDRKYACFHGGADTRVDAKRTDLHRSDTAILESGGRQGKIALVCAIRKCRRRLGIDLDAVLYTG